MLGAPLSVGSFLWKAMLPINLGITVGKALFTGLYKWWVFLHCEDRRESAMIWGIFKVERPRGGRQLGGLTAELLRVRFLVGMLRTGQKSRAEYEASRH